jgi:hypothetical protein
MVLAAFSTIQRYTCMLTNVICSFTLKKSHGARMISWKYSFRRLNEEYEIAKKKKQALDSLYETGKISQATRDSFDGDLTSAIAEIEKQQKELVAKMQGKVSELESQIKTLETLLANYEIQHVVGEIEEDVYQREIVLLSNGLDTAKHELENIKEATKQLSTPTAEAPTIIESPTPPLPEVEQTTEEHPVENATEAVAPPEIVSEAPLNIDTAPQPVIIETCRPEVPASNEAAPSPEPIIVEQEIAETPVIVSEENVPETVGAMSEVPAEIPTEVPAETPVEIPVEVPAEVPTEVTTEVPAETPIEVPVGVPSEVAVEAPAEVAVEAPVEVAVEAPAEVPAEIPEVVPDMAKEEVTSVAEMPLTEEAQPVAETDSPLEEPVIGDNEFPVDETTPIDAELTPYIEESPIVEEIAALEEIVKPAEGADAAHPQEAPKEAQPESANEAGTEKANSDEEATAAEETDTENVDS